MTENQRLLHAILSKPNKYNVQTVVWGKFSNLHKTLSLPNFVDESEETRKKLEFILEKYSILK